MNFTDNEIKLRILYWGTKNSGKTENINRLNERFGTMGRKITLLGEDGFTICFEFLEPVLKIKDAYGVRYLIYSSPDEAPALAQELVLQGIDGIVFVVDSDKNRLSDNKKALSELLKLLKEYEENDSKLQIPIVVQYNKRDLPTALPVETLKKELNLENYPYVEAEAINGKGVIETFVKIARESLKYFLKKKNSPE